MTHAINYQVSIRGKGIHRLTQRAMAELVERHLDQQPPTDHEVKIIVWKNGRQLDWRADNHRAEVLRATLRRLLQERQIQFDLRLSGK